MEFGYLVLKGCAFLSGDEKVTQQSRPPQVEWDLWLKALQSSFTSAGRALKEPLGNWNDTYITASPNWEFYIQRDTLYERLDNTWIKRQLKYSRSGRNKIFKSEGSACNAPPRLSPRTKIIQSVQHITATGTRNIQIPCRQIKATSFYDLLQHNPDSKWICSWLSHPQSLQALMEEAWREKLFLDGNFSGFLLTFVLVQLFSK